MKPIENIFGFDCATCEHNRNCYGGNMGNQFRYCEKSAKKIQNLDNLEKQNKQLKEIYKELFNTYQKLKKENEEVTSLNLHQVDKIQQLKEEIEEYKNPIKYFKYASKNVTEENKQLKDKLSKIETLIINHNRNIGDIYYKYNSKFLKSELKQRILEIVYEVSE